MISQYHENFFRFSRKKLDTKIVRVRRTRLSLHSFIGYVHINHLVLFRKYLVKKF